MAEALDYLHSRVPPTVFRDLKPENFMLRPDGQVMLIDFGVARPAMATGGTTIGTPGYAPPELYQGMAEPRPDQYALAASLNHMLTGRDPKRHMPFQFPPACDLVPELNPAVESALARALSMSADARYPDVQAFVTDRTRAPSVRRVGKR